LYYLIIDKQSTLTHICAMYDAIVVQETMKVFDGI